jgi:tetraacyldisaccharide 4'-kinase
VPLDEPSWWYDARRSAIAACLGPVALLYSWAAVRRFRSGEPYRSRLPVICVGNLTAGGTGKTPLVLHLCQRLRAMGRQPIALTRGYGGRHIAPHWVSDSDTADDVGDEALLLARAAPTVVARDRAEGARAAEAKFGADAVLVMDDGLQNPSLAKDLTIAVIDGSRGLGNCRVIPAGPLRAPLAFQLALVNAVVVNGGANDGIADWLRRGFAGPVLRTGTVPDGSTDWLRGTRVIAWAGIGSPQRFFRLLQDCGAELPQCVAFRDHQRLTERDADRLLRLSQRHGAGLVSTEKDIARLAGREGNLAALAAATKVLKIKLEFAAEDAQHLRSLIDTALTRHVSPPAA